MRLYDVLENSLIRLKEWRHSNEMSKDDVLDSMEEVVGMLMTHIITTPLIGTSFAYPGDIDSLELRLERAFAADSGATTTTTTMTTTRS